MRIRHSFVPVALAVGAVAAALVAPATPAVARGSAYVRVGPIDGVGRLAASAAADACDLVGQREDCGLIGSSREALGHGAAEYTFALRVGPGAHDRIAVHRVVQESHATIASTKRAAFFVPGDVWGFDTALAGALGQNVRAPNVAAYLAVRGIDVWGLDQRWVLVPAGVTDTSFMHKWGFATRLADMRLAMTFERLYRAATGSGFGKTALVGWSRGGQLAYAYASLETQLPAPARNVDALVPVDIAFHYSPADIAFRRGFCQIYRQEKADLDSGTSAVSFASLISYGRAALARPEAPAPDAPDLTNRQLALLVGAFSENDVFNPWYHFVAGPFDHAGVPVGLTYTPEGRWFRLLASAAPWSDLDGFVDGAALLCGRDTPFDDHLAQVRLPVLYLAAAGGFGTTGLYSTTLLGSHDVTRMIVRLKPRGSENRDFGHVDLWQASAAPGLVWQPLLGWLRQH